MPAASLQREDWVLLVLRAAHDNGLTAVKLQKTLFLLGEYRKKEVGRAFYQFRPYHYGPFCAEIYHDADSLALRDLVALDMSRGQSMRRYVLTEEGRKAAARAAKRAPEKALAYLQDVVEWAQPLPFNVLVRAVYDAFPKMRENSIFSEENED